MDILDKLRAIINHPVSIIRKGKKYVTDKHPAPKGVQLHKGPHGGTYYFVEDKHVKQGGKHHELVRSRGITQDQFKQIEEKYKQQGAESVHFIHVPGLEKDKNGNYLYNIYVNWGEKTQKKIEGQKAANKIKYAQRKQKVPKLKGPDIKDFEEAEFTEHEGVHSTPAYDRTNEGYVENGKYEIHPSGFSGAKLYHIDKEGNRSKVMYSNEKVWGDTSEEDIDRQKSYDKNVSSLKQSVNKLTQAGPGKRKYLIEDLERLNKEREEKRLAGKERKKTPAKNPIFEAHTALRTLIDANIAKKKMLDVPELRPDLHAVMQETLDKRMNQPGKVEEIENEETAMQHKRGDTPVRQFLAEHLKRHFPSASDDAIDEAARSGFYHHSAAKTGRISDSYHHSVHRLTRLMKQPSPPQVSEKPAEPAKPAEPEKVPESVEPDNSNPWTETSYKDPRVAGAAMQAMQARGKEDEVLQNEWQKDKGHIIRIRYRDKSKPEKTTEPGKPKPEAKKEARFVRKYYATTPESAEKHKQELEAQGREVKIVKKKFGDRFTYDVMHRAKTSGNPTITLPIDKTGKSRTWLRRIDGHLKGSTSDNIGDFVMPAKVEGGMHHYELEDGLYHGNMGSRSMNPEGETYFHVQGGKVTEVPEGERANHIKAHTPEISQDQFNQHMQDQAAKRNADNARNVAAVKDHNTAAQTIKDSTSRFYVGNTHPGMASTMKEKFNGRWNPESKHWAIYTSKSHEELSGALSKEFGPNVVTRNEREWFGQLNPPQQKRESIGRMVQSIYDHFKAVKNPQGADKAIKDAERMFNQAEEDVQAAGQKGAKALVQDPYLHDRWHRADEIIRKVTRE